MQEQFVEPVRFEKCMYCLSLRNHFLQFLVCRLFHLWDLLVGYNMIFLWSQPQHLELNPVNQTNMLFYEKLRMFENIELKLTLKIKSISQSHIRNVTFVCVTDEGFHNCNIMNLYRNL